MVKSFTHTDETERRLVKNMQKAGLEPDAIIHSSLITACTNGGQTDEALEAFGNMQKAGLELDVIGGLKSFL